MLPSKGYFRSVDCPFYKNNLCHRFYCHFRHIRKENSVSLDIGLTDTTNCEDDSLGYEDNLQEIKHVATEKRILPSKQTAFSEETKVIYREPVKASSKSYLLPINIPKYNPTPISQLKIRHKQIAEKPEENGISAISCNQINKVEINKDSNLIETLVGYFVENSTAHDSKIGEIRNFINEEVKNNSAINKNQSISSQTKYRNRKVQNHEHEKVVPLMNNKTLSKKRLLLKQETVCLNVKTNENEEKIRGVLDNETLLEDLMGDDVLDDNSTRNNASVTVSAKKINSKNNGNRAITNDIFNYKKCKLGCIGKYKQNYLANTKKFKHGIYIQGTKLRNMKQVQTNCNGSTCDNDQPEKSENLITKQTSDSSVSPEVILISDSEEIDECKLYDMMMDETTKYRTNPMEEFPEPKRKIRISHATQEVLTSTNLKQSNSRNLHKTFYNGETTHTGSKTRIRSAHKIQYNTLSLKSMTDHLSHWQQVKERVKNKCINPGGVEGYQNWARVKISPVPNVASLINSKKLLFLEIQQWKSKTNS